MIVTSYGYTALRKLLEIVRNSSESNDIMLIVGRVMIHERTEKKQEFRKSGTKKRATETPKNTAE